MKAILTKYHGATNTKGSRVSASDCDGNRVTITWQGEFDTEPNHRAAADALCAKMGWVGGEMAGGFTKDGMAFVFTSMPKFTKLDRKRTPKENPDG